MLVIGLRHVCYVLFLLGANTVVAGCPKNGMDATKPGLDIYLLLGQSNMAGRGVDPIPSSPSDAHIHVYQGADIWGAFHEPINHLGDVITKAGIGPGGAFARAMVKETMPSKCHLTTPLERLKFRGSSVGLVPLAVGGSELARWEPGGDLFVAAINHAKSAAKCGVVKAILWHQGESDAGDLKLAKSYSKRFSVMIQVFREKLGQKDLPVLVGTLGEFIDQYKNGRGLCCWRTINSQIATLPRTIPNIAVVDSIGLKDRGDGIHFNSASQLEFGKRYANALKMLNKQR